MPVVALEIDSTGAVKGLKQFEDAYQPAGKSVDNFNKKLDSARSALNSFGGSLAKYSATLGIAAGAFGAFAIKSASDLQETQGKFDVVFGKFDAGYQGLIEQSEAWAKNLNDNYGLSEEASKRYLSSIQDLIVPTGLVRDKSAELSNEFVKLAVDIASFNNKANTDVIADFQSALAGSAETMVKYGIDVRKTAVEQEALRLGLIKAGEELTRQASVQAIYSIALRESGDAVGDFNRTSESFANQQKVLQKNLQDFSATVGKELLPYATRAIKAINEWASAEGNLESVIQGGVEVLRAFFNAGAGVVLFFEAGAVGALEFASATLKVLKPLELLIDTLMGLGVIDIDTNPITNLQGKIQEMSTAVQEAMGRQWEGVEKTNKFFDELSNKYGEVAVAGETSAGQQVESQKKIQNAIDDTKKKLAEPGASIGEVSPKAFTDLAELESRIGANIDKTGTLDHTWKLVNGTWVEALKDGREITDGMAIKLDELTGKVAENKSAVEQVGGVWVQTGEALKGSISPALDELGKLKEQVKGTGAAAGEFAGKMEKLGSLAGHAEALQKEIKGIQEEFKAGLVTQEEYQSKFQQLTVAELALDKVKEKMSELTKEIKKGSEEVKKFTEANAEIDKVNKSLEGTSKSAKIASGSIDGIASALLKQQQLQDKITQIKDEIAKAGNNTELLKEKFTELVVAETALENVNEKVRQLKQNLKEANEQPPFAFVGSEADKLVEAVTGASDAVNGLADEFDALSKKTMLKENLEAKLKKLQEDLKKSGDNAKVAAEKIKQIAATRTAIGTLNEEIGKLEKKIKDVATAADEPSQRIKDMVTGLKDGFGTAGESVDKFNEKISKLADLKQVADALRTEINTLNEEFSSGSVTAEEYNSKLQQLTTAEGILKGVESQIDSIETSMKAAGTATDEFNKKLSSIAGTASQAAQAVAGIGAPGGIDPTKKRGFGFREGAGKTYTFEGSELNTINAIDAAIKAAREIAKGTGSSPDYGYLQELENKKRELQKQQQQGSTGTRAPTGVGIDPVIPGGTVINNYFPTASGPSEVANIIQQTARLKEIA